MVYAPTEDPRIVGITVKDCTTSGYVLFLYKCIVKDFECEVSLYYIVMYNNAASCITASCMLDKCIM